MSENEVVFEPYELVESNHPILHSKIESFDFANPEIDPVVLANRLIVTMNNKNGLGLSANQCGLPYRVFVLRADTVKACFNPKVLAISEEVVSLEEGCLSHPYLFVKIKRPVHIRVRYADAFGEIHTEKFIGMTARCFLHEYDHLEGINYLTRANPVLVERAKRTQLKLKRKMKNNEFKEAV